jgi:hypothetical protein
MKSPPPAPAGRSCAFATRRDPVPRLFLMFTLISGVPGPVRADAPSTQPAQTMSSPGASQPAPLYTLRERDLDALLPALRAEIPAVASRAVALARRNIGQPYHLFVLGEFPFETHDPDPLYCLSRSDCLTHVEHIYALAMSRDFWEYLRTLQRIRYRDGRIGFATRNHFTEADWNRSNAPFFEDITATLGETSPLRCRIRRKAFFADVPQAADAPPDEDFEGVYLASDRLAAALPSLRPGDVVQIVRGNARQQSVTHLGIATHASDGTVLFLHSGKPAVREEPLLAYVQRGKDIRGVKVLRVRPEAEANMAAALAEPAFAAQFTPQRWAEFVHRVPVRHHTDLLVGDGRGGVLRVPAEPRAAAAAAPVLAQLTADRPQFIFDDASPCAFPFSELIASWNVTASPGAWVEFELRVADRKGNWTEWMPLGRAGDDSAASTSAPSTNSAATGSAPSSNAAAAQPRVDVDLFRAPPGEKYERYQLRATLRATATANFAADHDTPPCARLHRLAVVYSDAHALRTHGLLPISLYRLACERANVPAWDGRGPDVANAPAMTVPFISQSAVEPPPGGRWCSPTSVAMTLAALGRPVATDRVAAAAYDRQFDIYGNWPRNVQAAFELAGTPGYVTRIADWPTAIGYLNAGVPLVISINFDHPQQLAGAPYDMTIGHLLVLRGIDGADAIVNDPAARDESGGRRHYSIADLEEVWMGNAGGVAYVLLPPSDSPR